MMAAVAANSRQKRIGAVARNSSPNRGRSSFSNRKSSVSSRMLKPKMRPNQSGWLSMALMRSHG